MIGFGPELEVGSILDQYQIEAPIARGGMGVVYQARDLRLNRKVALKVLAPELVANDEFRRRFVRESQVAAAIDHPNIIPIYGAGESEERLWIAMRFVEGITLRKLLERERRLGIDRTVSIISQVARALDAAHLRGLVHRDVKPGNVLLVPPASHELEEHVYLADFGLTKRQSDDSGITKTRQFLGTVDYMAPEQIQAQPIDGRADVYSLACMFHECLAGSPPFAKSTEVATIYAQLSEDPPSLIAIRPDLSPELDDILRRALAKNREDRYPTCGSMMIAIRSALRGTHDVAPTPTSSSEPSLVPPASFSEAAQRLQTHLPAKPEEAIAPSHDDIPTLEPTDVPANVPEATPMPKAAPSPVSDVVHPTEAPAEPRGRPPDVAPSAAPELDEPPTVVRASGGTGEASLATESAPISPEEALAPSGVATPRRRRRGLLAVSMLLIVGLVGGLVWFLSDRDKPQEVLTSTGARIFYIGSTGGTPRVNGGVPDAVSPNWWPGKQLAFQAKVDGNIDIYVVRANGTDPRRLTMDVDADSSPVWSPDGTRVAYVRPDVSGNEDIWVMNADGSDQHRLTSNPGRDIYPSWSPDGKEIVFVTGRLAGANLWLMNADGSNQRPLTDIGKDTEPSWGSNGLIAFARGKGDRHDIFVVMPDGSGLRNLTKNRSPDDLAPSWSPDGKRLAFVSELDGDYEIWVMNEDGSGLHQLTHGFARVGRRVTWSPSGKLLAFSALTD